MTTRFHSLTIRALTLHVTKIEKNFLEEKTTRFLEDSDKLKSSLGLKVNTHRLVAPQTQNSEIEKTASLLQEHSENYDLNYFALPLPENGPLDLLPSLFEDNPRLFTSIPFSSSNAEKIVDLLKTLSQKSWLYMARLAVAFGGRHNTPYFPATEAKLDGVTASLLYPKLLLETPFDEAKKTLWKLYEHMEANIRDFRGVDYSLSPWMDESVALVIEHVTGTQFTLPGTINGIIKINGKLEEIARRGGIGYNEIMLPLGEDNRLKQLARDGQLRFSHLLNYSAYCVAGLDMVPIPDTTDPAILLNTMRDLQSIYEKKGRPLAMRVILVGADEGEEISLGFFGKIPVLSPLY